MKLQVIREKTCRGCGQTMPLDMFGTDRREKDGKNTLCRACISAKHLREYERLRQDPEKYAKVLEQRRKCSEAYRRRRGAKVRIKVAVPAGMKRCPNCGAILPVDVFNGSYCRDCACQRLRERWERIKGTEWLHARHLAHCREVYRLKKQMKHGDKSMDGCTADAERPGDRG